METAVARGVLLLFSCTGYPFDPAECIDEIAHTLCDPGRILAVGALISGDGFEVALHVNAEDIAEAWETAEDALNRSGIFHTFERLGVGSFKAI